LEEDVSLSDLPREIDAVALALLRSSLRRALVPGAMTFSIQGPNLLEHAAVLFCSFSPMVRRRLLETASRALVRAQVDPLFSLFQLLSVVDGPLPIAFFPSSP